MSDERRWRQYSDRPRNPASSTRRVLIDQFLPTFDVSERHRVRVRASAPATYAALKTTDLAGSALPRVLLFLRAVPGALLRGVRGLRDLAARRHVPILLSTFESAGFQILAERSPEEIVIGLEGRFWRPSGALCTPSAEAFLSRAPLAGTARAVWNFTVRDLGGGASELVTETRVLCADRSTRLRFLPYWAVIRLWSGLIRRTMLAAIRRTAEGAGP